MDLLSTIFDALLLGIPLGATLIGVFLKLPLGFLFRVAEAKRGMIEGSGMSNLDQVRFFGDPNMEKLF